MSTFLKYTYIQPDWLLEAQGSLPEGWTLHLGRPRGSRGLYYGLQLRYRGPVNVPHRKFLVLDEVSLEEVRAFSGYIFQLGMTTFGTRASPFYTRSQDDLGRLPRRFFSTLELIEKEEDQEGDDELPKAG